MWILYLMVGLFVFAGIGIKYFKWYFLISGYNTMSKKQKENVDAEGLGKLMGNFMFLIAGLMFASGIAQQYGNRLLPLVFMLSIVPLTIVLIILAQKYDHNSMTKSDKTAIKVFIVLIMVTGILVSTMLIYGIREPKIEITSDKITISGMYSSSINKEDIREISLQDTIPKVLRKTNGFDFGYILRGNFTLDEIGVARIYIHENKAPYIVIKTENKYYIINYKDSNKTMELYNKIK